MSLFFKKYSILEVIIHLLIRFNIQRILIEMVQVNKTHTLHTEKDNFRKG